MRLESDKEANDQTNALRSGALKGVGLGALVSAGIFPIARRISGSQLKNGFVQNLYFLSPPVIGGMAYGEFDSHRLNNIKNFGTLKKFPMDTARTHHSRLKSDMKGFLDYHKYKLFLMGWAASLAGSYYVLNHDKYLNQVQKVTKSRLYAQGISILAILIAVFLSSQDVGSKEEKAESQKKDASRSWEPHLGFVEASNQKEHRN